MKAYAFGVNVEMISVVHILGFSRKLNIQRRRVQLTRLESIPIDGENRRKRRMDEGRGSIDTFPPIGCIFPRDNLREQIMYQGKDQETTDEESIVRSPVIEHCHGKKSCYTFRQPRALCFKDNKVFFSVPLDGPILSFVKSTMLHNG